MTFSETSTKESCDCMVHESPSTKVKEICDLLRKDTLDPAKKEAERIKHEAKKEAAHILQKAEEEATLVKENLAKELYKMQNVHEAAVQLAIRQGVSKLKQLVSQVFSDELQNLVVSELGKTDVMAKILSVLVSAIEKEGLSANLLAVLPKGVSTEEIQAKLVSNVAAKLKSNKIVFGDFIAGIELKILDKKFAIDMTDQAVKELIAMYCEDELREKIFQA